MGRSFVVREVKTLKIPCDGCITFAICISIVNNNFSPFDNMYILRKKCSLLHEYYWNTNVDSVEIHQLMKEIENGTSL